MEHLEVVKNSYKLVRAFQVELDLEALVFGEKKNRSTQGKSSRQRTNNKPILSYT